MKGQTASEFMIIIVVAMVLLLPLVFYMNESLSEYKDSSKISATKSLVSKLGESVDWVYSQGYPARLSLEVYVPKEIEEISVVNNTILFKLKTSTGINDIFYKTVPSLNGTIPTESGYYTISLTAFENYVNINVVK